mgnify:CR=1 FL=1|tara:strand:+ start:5302 stop:5844 length:543 start_codon:yes stop_codon:yes gene_type:complete
MHVFKFILGRYKGQGSSAIAYNNKSSAKDGVNGIIVEGIQDLFENRIIRTEDMVDMYNAYSMSTVKRFSDRLAGSTRLINLLNGLAGNSILEVRRSPEHPGSKVNKHIESRGRKSKFDNKRILLKSEETHNPRRKGSHGFTSYQIILENPGLTYEKFIELGGRRQDLAWDVEMKRFKVQR